MMTIQRRSTALALSLLLALSLSACGGSKSTSSGKSDETLVTQPTAEAQASGGFDNAITTPDKNSFTLSSPAAYTPGKFATGMVIGQTFNRFTVTVKNGGTQPLDLTALIVKGTTPGGECVDIFDGDNKMEGAPQEPLAAGTSLTFDWALSCAGKSGDVLTVVLFNGESALIEAKGKLA
jgi:hypothetical protein